MTTPRIGPKGKVFRDPVHGLIRIEPGDDFILDLIDTPEFQRLRRVRQLGVSCFTYHGAEHSRFVHSMGVFNFAQRMVQSLRRRYAGENRVLACLNEYERSIKAAALLHDLGHGPFSHVIERAFGAFVKHEYRTVQIVRNPESSVSQVLRAHSLDAESVASIIDTTHPCRLAVDIVSSQLDADRMDYLLRDSQCTGVEYGRYDQEWILNSLGIATDASISASQRPDGDKSRAWRLCLDRHRGLYAAEQLILARAYMSMQVYYHKATRGYEVMLLNLFAEAKRLHEADRLPKATPPVIVKFIESKGDLTLDQWLQFDEALMTTAMHSWSISKEPACDLLSQLASAYLRRERLYSGVDFQLTAASMSLESRLEKDGLIKGRDWEIDDAKFTPYKGLLLSAKRSSRDSETLSAESILLGGEEPDLLAIAVETESAVLRSLELDKRLLHRFYYVREKEGLFQPFLGELE